MAIILAAAGCLLSSALAQQTISIPKHVFGTGPPGVAAYSPDGKQLATGHGTGLYLWDVATGQRSQRFPGPVEPVRAIAFSPDGTRLLTHAARYMDKPGGSYCLVSTRMWDLPTMREVWSTTVESKSDHYGRHIAFSPDGSTVFARSLPDWQYITLLNAATGELLHVLDGRESLSDAVFSPDSATLLTGSRDWTARLWDVRTGEELRVFQGHLDRVESVAFSPDGTRVLTGSLDKTARVWDASDGRLLHTLSHFQPGLRQIVAAYAPEGSRILTLARSFIEGDQNVNLYTARQWDPETGLELSLAQSEHVDLPQPYPLAFSTDCTRIVVSLKHSWDYTSPGEVLLLDAVTLEELARIPTDPSGPALLSPDNDTVVILSDRSRGNTLYDTHTRQARFELNWPDGYEREALEVSPNGKLLLHYMNGFALYDIDSGNLIRSATSDNPPLSPFPIAGSYHGARFSPDNSKVLLWAGNAPSYQVWLYDIATDSIVGALATGEVVSAAFSPDGTHFLTGCSANQIVHLWNTDTMQLVRSYPQGSGGDSYHYSTLSLAFSPDGARIVTTDFNWWDGTSVLWMWDTQSASPLYAIELYAIEVSDSFPRYWYARFSPDGTKVLCYCDQGSIKVLDAATGLEVWTLPQPLEGIAGTVAAYSPDGSMIVAGSEDGLTFWDTTTWQQLDLTVRCPEPYPIDFGGVAFSLDGRTLFTAQRDAVAMWDLVPVPELVIAREAGGRLVLTWQNPVLGGAYELEQCADLATGDWTEVPVAEPGRHELAVPAPAAMFYRLKEL